MLELLGGIASGTIPLTHDGLTAAGFGRHVDHLRSILQHHVLLPGRDEHLARFEVWLAAKLDAVDSPHGARTGRTVRDLAPPTTLTKRVQTRPIGRVSRRCGSNSCS